MSRISSFKDIKKSMLTATQKCQKLKRKYLPITNKCLRSNSSEVLLGKDVLKMSSKFRGEDPCRSAIPINLQGNFIEIALRHVCFPINLLHIFRTPLPKNTSGWLLLITNPEFNTLTEKLMEYQNNQIQQVKLILVSS